MKFKVFLSLVGLVVVVAAIVVIKGKQFAPPPPFEFPPTLVSTAVAESQQWEQTARAVGSLRADQGVVVAVEIPGTVNRIAFKSGAQVAAGDLLVELDASVERAQLRSAQASAQLAQIDLKRSEDLRKMNTISQSELDIARAGAMQSAAQVDNIQAAIDKKAIRAPFAGRLGIRQVNLGQVLSSGAPVVSLQSLDPIQVDFNLPQQQLDRVQVGYRVRVRTDARPGKAFEGVVTAINPQIDIATRSVAIQATLSNSSELLRPGMFAEVEVVQPETKSVVVVPATAVYYQSFGDTVFVSVMADKDGKQRRVAEQRFVRLGESRGDFIVVEDGIEPGEEVISAGAFKLRNGGPIAIDNSQVLEMSLTPEVEDS